jgi:glycyl-tRNA synthetase beta chain
LCTAARALGVRAVLLSFLPGSLFALMPAFLLEVGTEELPAGTVAPAVEQMKTALVTRLEAERLPVPASGVRTLATPRRLALLVHDLPERQPDAPVEARGPSAKAAFGPDGAPTKAAEGFARKQGVAVTDLIVEGEYVVARRTLPGRLTGDVLAEIVPDLLRAVTFPKFMRWGAGNYRWGRPIRRFVALLGDQVVPFEVEGVRSGNATVGHRDLAGSGPVVIPSPDGYADALRRAFVEPDPGVRHTQIVEQARTLVQTVNGRALLDPDLIDENVYLTEQVTAVLGRFDAAYLDLPRPVLVTAMRKHQRFFPVEGEDGRLLPFFIAIRNGSDAHLDTVRSGYEKVLASRFNDAKFFFDHDRESPLEAKLPRTERIVFQEKLGSLPTRRAVWKPCWTPPACSPAPARTRPPRAAPSRLPRPTLPPRS